MTAGSNPAHAQAFWVETFGNTAAGSCDQGTLANGFVSTNGTWTVTAVGPEGPTPNQWYISATEPGRAAGDCSTQGCYINPQYTDRTLHVGNLASSPNAGTLSIGRLWVRFTMQADFNLLPYKPIQEQSLRQWVGGPRWNYSLFLIFSKMRMIQQGNDDVSVEYFDGTTWTTIADPPQTDPGCGQRIWNVTQYAVALGASADNNQMNVKIGFTWINDEGGVGVNPSFAVDSIALIGTLAPVADFTASDTVLCTGDCIDFTDLSNNFPTAWAWSFIEGILPLHLFRILRLFVSSTRYIYSSVDRQQWNGHRYSHQNRLHHCECLYSANRGIQCRQYKFLWAYLHQFHRWKHQRRECLEMVISEELEHFNWSESATNLLLHSGIVFRYTNLYNQFGSDTLVLTDYINVNTCPLPVADLPRLLLHFVQIPALTFFWSVNI